MVYDSGAEGIVSTGGLVAAGRERPPSHCVLLTADLWRVKVPPHDDPHLFWRDQSWSTTDHSLKSENKLLTAAVCEDAANSNSAFDFSETIK